MKTGISTDIPHGMDPVDIALVMESTYPYRLGGLSAVVEDIVVANPERSIGIIHITWDDDSDMTVRYDIPENVRWIYHVYQSMDKHKDDFGALRPNRLGLSKRGRRQLAAEVVEAVRRAGQGRFDGLWSLYDSGVNPRTRRYPLMALLGSREFMHAAQEASRPLEMPATELFWQLREFFSLVAAVAGADYPAASIYHAHTTGYAGLAAAVAARQNGGRLLLTEHNLYTRDTINDLLHRSMASRVTADEYRRIGGITAQQRAWMAWFTEMGRLTYQASDTITYLYPGAIDEAQELGSVPARSRVLPNGIRMEKFAAARQRFLERQTSAPPWEEDRTWRFGYAARLVPIKGMLDLLESVKILVDQGVKNFQVEVMGPADEDPEYAAHCYERCSELGLDAWVRFVGQQKLDEVFDSVDIMLLPSHNEGQPMSVLEAMTIGIPIVGTDVGGMRQLVEDPLPGAGGGLDPCGIIIEPHDRRAMAAGVLRLMSDAGFYQRCSRTARRRVIDCFQLHTAMDGYRRMYRETLEGPGRADRIDIEDLGALIDLTFPDARLAAAAQ